MQQQSNNDSAVDSKPKNGLNNIFQNVGKKINDIFKPEEVEVTIEGTGYNQTYTYTKAKNN